MTSLSGSADIPAGRGFSAPWRKSAWPGISPRIGVLPALALHGLHSLPPKKMDMGYSDAIAFWLAANHANHASG